MLRHQFWPLDPDPDGEIYENLAWDLPGFRTGRSVSTRHLEENARARNPYTRNSR